MKNVIKISFVALTVLMGNAVFAFDADQIETAIAHGNSQFFEEAHPLCFGYRRDMTMKTLAHLAVANKKFKVAEVLYLRGMNFNLEDGARQTPLIEAIRDRNLEGIIFLMSKPRVDIARNNPLMAAIESEDEAIVAVVTQLSIDWLETIKDGRTLCLWIPQHKDMVQQARHLLNDIVVPMEEREEGINVPFGPIADRKYAIHDSLERYERCLIDLEAKIG